MKDVTRRRKKEGVLLESRTRMVDVAFSLCRWVSVPAGGPRFHRFGLVCLFDLIKNLCLFPGFLSGSFVGTSVFLVIGAASAKVPFNFTRSA